jgi:signal-transduction protein with cAMP-binding, CBS, and nucleotidyltransferase domain
MEQAACGALVVLDAADRLAGIVTDRDLALVIGNAKGDPSQRVVGEAMTRDVRTCLPDDDLAVALERMSEEKVRRLPVVDGEGTVEGMLSIDDIILWGLGHRGIKRKVLVKALRSICAAHNPMFETEDVEVCAVGNLEE